MTPTNDGGPAFPQSVSAGIIGAGCGPHVEWGMTLRDYFAAKAMPAVITSDYGKHPTCKDATWSDSAAAWAYEIADAMILARNHYKQ